MAVEKTVTEVEPGDTRNDVLDTLAEGEPWVFIIARIDRASGELALKVEVGGGIPDEETIRNLLEKTIRALG